MKHRLAFLFVMFSLWAVFPAAHAASEMAALLGQIAAALGAGDAAGAEKLADDALQAGAAGPADHARLLVDRGLAREGLGRRDDALLDLTAAINLGSLASDEQANALFDRGVTLDEMGRAGDAVGDYSAAIGLVPRFARALNNRANAYRLQGHYAEAERDYRASLAAGNANPEYPYYGLGQIAEARGDLAAARDDYTRALAANPRYDLAVAGLAALGAPVAAAETAASNTGASSPPDPGIIVLHPPPGMSAATAPASGAPDRIVLHPPATIHLHPPGQQSTLTPASYGGGGGAAPDLRPALADGGSGSEVQLGAWRSEAEAAEGWNRIAKEAGGLLQGLSPHILAADLPGKGRYYRLRVGPVAHGDASRLCAALEEKDLDCVPAWN